MSSLRIQNVFKPIQPDKSTPNQTVLIKPRFTKACSCGEYMTLDYLKKFYLVHKKLKCSNCKSLVSIRCGNCIKKQACVKSVKNGGKTHLFCDKCNICYLCTPCSECEDNLGMVNTMVKICCTCRERIPNRCNNCMIKNICKCSQEHCSKCKGCGLKTNLFG